MDDTATIAHTTQETASKSPGIKSSRFFRSLVERSLSRIKYGQIVLRDGDRELVCGSDASTRVTVTVLDPSFYWSLAVNGSIGAAESYFRGHWRADNLVLLIQLMVRNREVLEQVDSGFARVFAWVNTWRHRARANSMVGSRRNIRAHYDLSNEFYRLFLDRTMTYSSGIFPYRGASLEAASIEKLDRICRKLALSPADHVLEIGGGWGSFAIHAARTYGCHVTTTTISEKQFSYLRQAVDEAGLTDRITVLNKDYRSLEGQYDKIVSIEMIEAVGYGYVPGFLRQCMQLLRPEGVMAIQAITMADHLFDSYRRSADFIQTHIFPGACLVSMSQVASTLKKSTDFRMIHLEDITAHYVQTLRLWRERFMARTDEVRALGFTDQFVRLWEFYLAYCEGGFRERQIGTVQCVFARPGYRADTDVEFAKGRIDA